MPHGFYNLPEMTVSGTPGSGNITLGSAVSGFQTFAAAGVRSGERVSISVRDGSAWSLERAVYSSTGPVLSSRSNVASSTGSLLSLTSAATVAVVELGEDLAGPKLPITPAVYLDFTTGVYHVSPYHEADPLTFSRATAAWIDDSSGNWSQVAANTLRRSDKGILIEEARTNSVRNNSMQGAVVGSPGTAPTNWQVQPATGFTTAVAGLSTVNGIDVIDIAVSGTNTASNTNVDFETSSGIAATIGQTWTISAFLALIAGSIPASASSISLRIFELNSSGTFLAQNAAIDLKGLLTGTPQRFNTTYTTVNAACAAVRPVLVMVLPTDATAKSLTLRIGWPQLELANGATSPIRTTSAAATRSADVLSLANPPSFGSKMAIAAFGTPSEPTGNGSDQYLCSVSDGSSSNRFGIVRQQTTGIPAYVIDATKTGIGTSAWAQSAAGAVAAGYAVSDQVGAFSGSAVALGSSAVTFSGLNRVEIGSDGAGANQFNGYITKLMMFPTGRPDNNSVSLLSDTSGSYDPIYGHLRTAPTSKQSAPSDPTGTTSTTGVMMGFGVPITPSKSGSVLLTVSGTLSNNTANDGAKAQLRYGTGTAPSNGAALTGTTAGGTPQHVAANASNKSPFALNAIIQLTRGTTYWIDVSLAAITGGTASMTDLSISAVEL